MHLQEPIPGWPSVLAHLPDGALLKAFDGALLREAKLAWAALGRDPARLITFLRHYNVEPAPRHADWPGALAHWRRMFARVIDGTYLREYAGHVDLIGDANEWTAESTWSDPDGGAWAMQSMRAAAVVWNDEYRGRAVRSDDGGAGEIPAGCQLALMAGPVANRFPRTVLRLAVTEDCPLDYHAYSLWTDRQRHPRDWPDHSGLWHTLEQEYGLKPRWVFGESGPYAGVNEGWRDRTVCDGRVELLVAAMVAWVQDLARTPAYAEGRLLGPGAWFTSNTGGSWPLYRLDAPELIAIANTIRPLWRPGKQETDVDAVTRAKLLEHVEAMRTLLDAAWWQQLAPGASVRAIAPTWIYADAALTKKNRQKDEGETMQVWRSQAGPTWSGESVCVFSSTQLELWAPAAALERV